MTGQLWSSVAWRSEATAWVDDRLAALGRVRTGALEQPRIRPWGTVLHAPTDSGRVWLKAPARDLRFELPLLDALASLGLDGVPLVLGTDTGRGLLLLADAGTSFRDRWPDDGELATHHALAWPVMARLQRAATPLVPDLLAAGVADLRPAALPARFDEAVARAGAAYDTPDDVDLLDRLAALRPRFVDLCAELDSSRLSSTIDHNDVHQGNLAIDGNGRLTVLDWGDAVVAHPFSVLLSAQRTLADLVGGGSDHPVVVTARRAYLAVFAPDAGEEDLERTAHVAVTLAQVGRAWVWQRALATFDDAAGFEPPAAWPEDFDRGPVRHLRHALDALERTGP